MEESNWGHSVSIWIAIEGERKPNEGKAIIAASKAAEETLQEHGIEIEFVGATIRHIKDKPYDQVAT